MTDFVSSYKNGELGIVDCLANGDPSDHIKGFFISKNYIFQNLFDISI